MNNPITPYQVEQEMRRIHHALNEELEDYARLAEKAGEAEVAHKVARAQAFLIARDEGKTVAEAEARAEIGAQAEHRQRALAESAANVSKERLRTMQSQLSALQTLGRQVGEMTGSRS